MTNYEKVIAVLNEIKPAKDLEGITDIIDGGYLDSFELMALIAKLDEDFGIEISIDDIAPENFNSCEAIVLMVERLLG